MPRFPVPERQRRFAKTLRANPSRAEQVMWQVLRANRLERWKFKRQVPIGPFIADFVCFEGRLVIELDGPPHDTSEQRAKDEARDAWLRSQDFRVLRLSNDLVLGSVEIAAERILEALGGSTPPSPDPA
jgi:very-short-patch-repair endonuclease